MGMANITDSSAPYADAVPYTSGDAAFAESRGFYVGAAGTLTVVTATGAMRAFAAAAAGYHPLSVTRFVSGTATGLMACY